MFLDPICVKVSQTWASGRVFTSVAVEKDEDGPKTAAGDTLAGWNALRAVGRAKVLPTPRMAVSEYFPNISFLSSPVEVQSTNSDSSF